MKRADLVIALRDPMVFRDGRPFGQAGTPQTGTLNWPRPGTVLGMARTYLGVLRSPDYFGTETQSPIDSVKQISMEWFLPVVSAPQRFTVCPPAPADAVVFDAESRDGKKRFDVLPVRPLSMAPEEGTDLPWKDWAIPWIAERRKPDKTAPPFWHWDQMKEWLVTGRIDKGVFPESLGIGSPATEERTHVCIDPASGAAAESRLFTTMGLRFDENLFIGAKFQMEDADQPPPRDVAALGGDRRPAYLTWGEKLVDWPEAPPDLGKADGLRLVLITPGLFAGGWAPDWLTPSLETGTFVKVPDTDIRIRLRSACVPRWAAHHGWDMTIGKKGAPKPMRKMVVQGAVYFVEPEPGIDATIAARILWNRSLCEDEQDRRDGFGRVLVGNWRIETGSRR